MHAESTSNVYAVEIKRTTILSNNNYALISPRPDHCILGLLSWSFKSFAIVNTFLESTPLLYPTITEHDETMSILVLLI